MSSFFKTLNNSIKNWYVPGIVGLISILIGIYLLSAPLSTYVALTLLFSISFFVTGILETFFSIQNRNKLDGWGWYLAGGIFNLLLGLMLIAKPEIAALTLPFFVGFSLLFRSFQGLGFAFDLKNYGVINWGNLAVASVLGIIFSMMLIASPVFAGLSLVLLTALSFISTGIIAIVLSFQLKKLKSASSKISHEFKEKMENLKEEYHNFLKDRKD